MEMLDTRNEGEGKKSSKSKEKPKFLTANRMPGLNKIKEMYLFFNTALLAAKRTAIQCDT